VPPGHGGVPPGLAKKGGVPPGLAKKGYRPVAWYRGAPPWYGHTLHGTGGGYRQPYGVYRDTCYREDLGRALGAVAGGVTGYQFGGGHGKAAAVIGGTIIGALIGGNIGRSMDDLDQNCVGQILEHAPPNQPITWRDQGGAGRYEVIPSPAYQDRQGRYCREYQSTATIGGQSQPTYGTACRQPDGSWQIVN
jgi:surface antigen